MGLNLRLPCEAPEAGVSSFSRCLKKAKQNTHTKKDPPQKTRKAPCASVLPNCFIFHLNFCHHHFIALRSCKNTWTKYVNKITGTVPDDCKLSIYFWTCLSYFEQMWVGVGVGLDG